MSDLHSSHLQSGKLEPVSMTQALVKLKQSRRNFSLQIGELVIEGSEIKVLGSGHILLNDDKGRVMGLIHGQLAEQVSSQIPPKRK